MHQRTETRLRLQARALHEEIKQAKANVPPFAIGKKNVLQSIGLNRPRTLQRWRRMGLPVRRGQDGKLFAVLLEVQEWLLAFHTLQQERTKARLAAYTLTFRPGP